MVDHLEQAMIGRSFIIKHMKQWLQYVAILELYRTWDKETGAAWLFVIALVAR